MKDKIRMGAILLISFFVIITGVLFAMKAFMKGNVAGGIAGAVIAIIILVFAGFVFIRGSRDLKKGFPLQDERSKRVMDKASSRSRIGKLPVSASSA